MESYKEKLTAIYYDMVKQLNKKSRAQKILATHARLSRPIAKARRDAIDAAHDQSVVGASHLAGCPRRIYLELAGTDASIYRSSKRRPVDESLLLRFQLGNMVHAWVQALFLNWPDWKCDVEVEATGNHVFCYIDIKTEDEEGVHLFEIKSAPPYMLKHELPFHNAALQLAGNMRALDEEVKHLVAMYVDTTTLKPIFKVADMTHDTPTWAIEAVAEVDEIISRTLKSLKLGSLPPRTLKRSYYCNNCPFYEKLCALEERDGYK